MSLPVRERVKTLTNTFRSFDFDSPGEQQDQMILLSAKHLRVFSSFGNRLLHFEKSAVTKINKSTTKFAITKETITGVK